MIPTTDCFSLEEKLIYELRALYESYGWRRYKMSRFEEYELYAKNKRFLESENIVTFTDPGGRLLALKPDVTLSIVKSALAGDVSDDVKLHYNEDVFRADPSTHEIKRIMQVGIEHIGNIDLYSTAETVCLAKQSLSRIDQNNILDLSHLGFVSGLLYGIDEPLQRRLLRRISEKNAHEILLISKENGIDEQRADMIARLASLYGPFESTIDKARELIISDEMSVAADELCNIYNVLKNTGYGDNINLDFSIVNDMNYYNGIIFQGYVKNVPTYVLSGGRYDRLIEKMGDDKSAIGFAVYLDLIESYDEDKNTADCDVLILYNDKTDEAKLLSTVGSYVNTGRKVITSHTGKGFAAENTVDMRG